MGQNKQTFKFLLCTAIAAVFTAGCDSGGKNETQELPIPKTSPEAVAIMNPFTLEYGSSVPLLPELNVSPDSWPRGALDRFTVPLHHDAELPMFVDFEINTILPENIIYSSSASRTYPNTISCHNAKKKLSQIVVRKIPNLTPTTHGYENSELGVYVRCSRHPGDIFIGLDLAIFHKKSRNLIDVSDETKVQFEN